MFKQKEFQTGGGGNLPQIMHYIVHIYFGKGNNNYVSMINVLDIIWCVSLNRLFD